MRVTLKKLDKTYSEQDFNDKRKIRIYINYGDTNIEVREGQVLRYEIDRDEYKVLLRVTRAGRIFDREPDFNFGAYSGHKKRETKVPYERKFNISRIGLVEVLSQYRHWKTLKPKK